MKRPSSVVASAVLLACWAAHAAEVQPQLPVIPERRFVITEFGAVGDGAAINTQAIGETVAACEAAGGGVVVVPEGTFVTGPFTLGGSMALEFEDAATLRASEEVDDDRQPGGQGKDTRENGLGNVPWPLISATGVANIAIRGHGTIDGAGQRWWERSRAGSRAGAASQEREATGAVALSPRPRLVLFSDCGPVHIQGVTFKDAPNAHLGACRCHDVLIEDVTITAPRDAPNTDGIAPGSSREVVMRRCHIAVGGDHISFTSYPGQPPLEHVHVHDCTFGCGQGTSVGSSIGGGVRHILVERCTFTGANPAIRIASARDRGGLVEDIVVRELRLRDVGTAIQINLFSFDAAAQQEREPKPVTSTTPIVRQIRISDIAITGATTIGEVIGLPEMPIADLTLERIRAVADTGLTIRDVAGLELREVEIRPRQGEALTISRTTYRQ